MIKAICFSGESKRNTLEIGKKNYRVELLKTIKKKHGNFFVYSPLQSKIYQLTQQEYNFVEKNPKVSGSEKNRELIETGLFLPEKNEGIPSRKDLEKHHSLALFPTTECNAACIYCYADSEKKGKAMDFETAKNAIDHYSKEKPLQEIFFHGGGEPTLAFPLIKEITAYAKKKNPKIKTGIQSNGFFPVEIAEWISENIDIVSISCDGPPEIQNFQRPIENGKNSSKAVEKNIKFLSEKKQVGINATVISKNAGRQEEVLEYAFRMGIKDAEFGPFIASKKSKGNRLSISLNAFVDGFLKAKEFAEEFGMLLHSEFLPLKARYSLCGFCKPLVAITTDGFVSACWETTSKESGPQEFIYGKMAQKDPVFDERALEKIKSRAVENMPECRECWLKWTCAGGCASHEFKESNDLMKPSKKRCKAKKKAVSKYLDYRIEKDFVRIKPFFEERGGETIYSLFFRELKVKKAQNLKALEENPLIEITPRTGFKSLASTIIKHRDNRQFKPTFFFLRFRFKRNDLNPATGKKIESFLSALKKEKIHFKISLPLPKCIFGIEYEDIVEKYSAPKNFEDCLDLFKVKNGRVFFGSTNGKLWVKKARGRKEIMKMRGKIKPISLPKICSECIYLWRGQCGGLIEQN